jgi:pimeloyl-ACP methyl ester carboxylesterase
MALFQRDDAAIHYEVHGDGYPLVLFAPGGMNSIARLWTERPDAPGQPMPWIDPTRELIQDFQVIAMDQRNAGASTAPIEVGDGWATFTADHVALLDHLGLERVHIMGGCIGSSYCLGLCQAAPDRITAAVLQNPIGLSDGAANRSAFIEMFDGWADALKKRRGDVHDDALTALRDSMFGGDFVFSVDRDFVRQTTIPFLVLAGHDEFHPEATAREIANLAPTADLVIEWAGPDHHDVTLAKVRDFLKAHTP